MTTKTRKIVSIKEVSRFRTPDFLKALLSVDEAGVGAFQLEGADGKRCLIGHLLAAKDLKIPQPDFGRGDANMHSPYWSKYMHYYELGRVLAGDFGFDRCELTGFNDGLLNDEAEDVIRTFLSFGVAGAFEDLD